MVNFNKPISVIVAVDVEGNITPLRIQFQDENEELQVVHFDKDGVYEIAVPQWDKNRIKRFQCRGPFNGYKVNFFLEYNINNNKWVIYKM